MSKAPLDKRKEKKIREGKKKRIKHRKIKVLSKFKIDSVPLC
ncbi:hypothetical protein GAGA_3150 [Paraglaciecola agarilytica NO2]|uniref:Uncharacterized protein n=1 Tax=Paraglaciecola agarilytica NO2 TaxID=1125747 RepID=A0ABQ0IAA0_9ALTE|nr:hypothetical protein GAGA_3150 [Paraglaciecola agarilytica NO2]